jgi:hypothetical protein
LLFEAERTSDLVNVPPVELFSDGLDEPDVVAE